MIDPRKKNTRHDRPQTQKILDRQTQDMTNPRQKNTRHNEFQT